MCSSDLWLLIGKIIRINLSFSLLGALLLNLFPSAFLSIYGQGPGFIGDAIPVIRVVSVAMLLMAVSTVLLNAVTGTGNSRVTFLIEACVIVLYCVYVYLVFDRFFLPISIGWMSEWLYWIGILIPSYFYLRSGKWKNKMI